MRYANLIAISLKLIYKSSIMQIERIKYLFKKTLVFLTDGFTQKYKEFMGHSLELCFITIVYLSVTNKFLCTTYGETAVK